MVHILQSLLFAYVVVACFLYFFQRSLLYYPAQDMAAPQAYGLPMQVVVLSSPVTITAWYAESKDNMPTILFAHGNAGHLGYRAAKFRAFLERGFGLLAVSYRGYGTSEGHPTEQGLYEDMRAGLHFLEERGLKPENIILYGESLGTGPIVTLAMDSRFQAAVLEAPFTSVSARAAEIYRIFPAQWMVKDRFDSLSKINRVVSPVLILHGTLDTIVPVTHGKKLFAAANEPKQIVLLENAGHNDLDPEKLAEAVTIFVTPNSSNP